MSEYHFGAFISYRRGGDDEAVARALHRLLEAYRTPRRLVKMGVPARIGRVFLDTAEREAAPSLDESIHADLEASRWLIVVCSRRTPKSTWVEQEIAYFSASHPDRVLALLIDGEPGQSYPPALTQLGDPKAADIRAASRQKMLAKLRQTEKLALIAPILGIRYDDLKARELQRRRRRITTASVTASVLIAALTALSLMVRSERLKTEMSEALDRFTTRAITALENEDDSTSALFLARISYLYNRQNGMGKTALIDRTVRRILGVPYLNFTLFSDTRDISAAALSFDGRWLALTGDYPVVRIFDLQDISRSPLEISHRFLNIRTLTFGPDSHRLIGIEETGNLLVWPDIVNDQTSQAIRLEGIKSFSKSTMSADARSIAAGTHDGKILLWQMDAPGSAARRCCHDGKVSSLAFNPGDSRMLASGGYDSSVRIWIKEEDEAQQEFAMDSPVTAVAFSSDGALLAVGTKGKIFTADRDAMSPRGSVYLLRYESGRYSEPTLLGDHHGSVESLSFSPDEMQVASAGVGDGKVKLWDLKSGTIVGELGRNSGTLVDLFYGHDGRHLYTVDTGDKGVQPAKLKVWILGRPAAKPEILEYHDGAVHALEFVPGRPLLASTGGYDGQAIVRDVSNGESIRHYRTEDYSYESLAVTPGGQYLFTAGRMFLGGNADFGIRQWNLESGGDEPENIYRGHESAVIALAVSSDERWLASTASSDNNIQLWKVGNDRAEDRSWDTGEAGALDVQFRPGRHELAWADDSVANDSVFIHLATAEDRSTERVWPAHQLGVSALQFSGSGDALFSASFDGSIKQWDLSAGSVRSAFRFLQPSSVTALSFDEKSRTLGSGGEDGVVRLWFTSDATDEYSDLRTTENKILSLSFGLDGKYLAAGSTDNRIYLWRTLESLASEACQMVGRNPTPDEWLTLVNGADGRPDYAGERCICFPESQCD